MTSDDGDLLRVTGAISDGERVDWEHESTKSTELSELADELRALQSIATIHRPVTPETSGATTAEWGPLRIIERIGEGSFGEVFRAHDPALHRDVALKLLRPNQLSPAAAAPFMTEARRLAAVRHPNLLVVHGAAIHDGRVGLWTDLVHGLTLDQLLERLGRLGTFEAAGVGMQVCRALAAVHTAGLIHLDVKAANVMREDGGRIVLMDFGAMRKLEGQGAMQEGFGTPLSMAPEQLRGDEVAAATDIYGLGVLLYFLVSGRYPVQAESLPQLAELVLSGKTIPLRDIRPDLPAEFARVVERAINIEPSQRFPSAGAMERALAMSAGTFTRSELFPRYVSAAPIGRRSNAAIIAVALGIVLLAVLVKAFFWR